MLQSLFDVFICTVSKEGEKQKYRIKLLAYRKYMLQKGNKSET